MHFCPENVFLRISIHALREEGDMRILWDSFSDDEFLSTPSARRATQLSGFFYDSHHKFLSTPSARRATRFASSVLLSGVISIHALREEGDAAAVAKALETQQFLSTPSARRATEQRDDAADDVMRFLSTPSARRATARH